MDTTRCVDKDVRFWDGDKIIPFAGNPDSIGLYCIFKESIDLPALTVNEDTIIRLIDSCMINASESDYLQFPDSSGYFVELLIYEDSSMLDMLIRPIPNYDMARILASDNNIMLLEWYGRREKYLQGCFFLNDILCVVTTNGRVDYEKASCLFSQTQSKIRLILYSPVVTKVKVSDNWTTCHYCFHDCDYTSDTRDVKKDANND